MSMYALASQLINLPIVSLQTGQPVAFLGRPIINPDNLELLAFYCAASRFRKSNQVLLAKDIRQTASDGIVVDSLEDIEDANEIVRLKSVIDRRFNPMGLPVVSESGFKLGVVEEFTVNLKTFQIQKLYLKQSVIKNLLMNNLVIDRSQITEVTPKQIIVRDATVREPMLGPKPVALE